MTPDAAHKILEPLLLAGAVTAACFALAVILLVVHGRRMKAAERGG